MGRRERWWEGGTEGREEKERMRSREEGGRRKRREEEGRWNEKGGREEE